MIPSERITQNIIYLEAIMILYLGKIPQVFIPKYSFLRIILFLEHHGSAIFDSLVLSLTYPGVSCVYGDTNSPMTVKVYQMAQSIYNDSAYFSNRDFLTSGVPLAIKTFVPKPRDSVIIGKDTLAPQLRIRS